MGKQLNDISVDTYLLVGENDILIPPEKSVDHAQKHLKNHLKKVEIFKQVGHGIECYKPCLDYIENTIETLNRKAEK
jgi:pimeloyl-ACP methyl ester carboxylesterase